MKTFSDWLKLQEVGTTCAGGSGGFSSSMVAVVPSIVGGMVKRKSPKKIATESFISWLKNKNEYATTAVANPANPAAAPTVWTGPIPFKVQQGGTVNQPQAPQAALTAPSNQVISTPQTPVTLKSTDFRGNKTTFDAVSRLIADPKTNPSLASQAKSALVAASAAPNDINAKKKMDDLARAAQQTAQQTY